MAEQENTLLNADDLYIEVEGEDGKELNLEFDQKLNLVGVVQDRFKVAEDARRIDERRWIKSYENYRGLYGKQIRFRESEKSRVFVKITKTKVLAAFGQLVDVIFGTGKFYKEKQDEKKENIYSDIDEMLNSTLNTDDEKK